MNEYIIDDIIFQNEEDANKVISDLNMVFETYGTVSVADLYDLSGITGGYKDCRYGWTDISSARIQFYETKNVSGYALTIDAPKKFK